MELIFLSAFICLSEITPLEGQRRLSAGKLLRAHGEKEIGVRKGEGME